MQTGSEALVFDMDGTLFQTEKVAIPAFYRTFEMLREQGWVQGKAPSEEEIQSVFGMTQAEIWNRLLPEASDEVKKQADKWWLMHELACIREGMGELYPGVAETLGDLNAQGWPLYIASNGLGPYIRGILAYYNLDSLFSGVYSAGEQCIGEKERLVEKLIQDHGVQSGYMIGDRSSDVRAGKANHLKVVGCRYTDYPQFAEEDELAGADWILTSFDQLPSLLKG